MKGRVLVCEFGFIFVGREECVWVVYGLWRVWWGNVEISVCVIGYRFSCIWDCLKFLWLVIWYGEECCGWVYEWEEIGGVEVWVMDMDIYVVFDLCMCLWSFLILFLLIRYWKFCFWLWFFVVEVILLWFLVIFCVLDLIGLGIFVKVVYWLIFLSILLRFVFFFWSLNLVLFCWMVVNFVRVSCFVR